MRFDRLDILRYGALTDRSLAFRPDAQLHIIYGPNEAGKSSALSAISDLLFGFPDRTPYGFLSDPATLRIGASISSRTGAGLQFRRRKGRKSTLLSGSEAEEALPDDALTPFLGTLSRDVFERAFGLNSASLRAGGETMLKSGGEIGSLLFSAASGLTGLSDLRRQLEAEAETIYAPRRSKDRLFYQVLDSHEEARRAERDNELKSGDWKKIVAEEAEIEGDLRSVQAEREDTKRALDRLRRLLRLEPVLREIETEREMLARYEPFADLPFGFADKLSAALDAGRQTADARHSSETDMARLKDEIAAVHVDEALISATPAIVAAHAGTGAYLNSRDDIARVRHEVEGFDLRLAQNARRLGFAGLEDLQRAQPADADLVRLREAVDKGTEIDRSLRQLRERITEERDALRRLEMDAARGRIVDPKPWADRLGALAPDIALLSGLEALKVRVTRAQSDLDAACQRLDPPVKDASLLLSVALPDTATLTRHRHVIEAARAEKLQASQKLTGLRAEAGEIEAQLAALEGGRRIVSREDIVSARSRRDAQVAALGIKPSKTVLDGVQAAIAEADALSDTALSDAERVSHHAQLTLRQRDNDRKTAAAETVAREAEIAASDAVTEFEDLFHAAPVTPSTPERMIEWRRNVEALGGLAAALDAARDALEEIRLKEEALRPSVDALAEAVGLSPDGLPVAALARAVERKISEIAESWNENRSLERLRASAQEALARLEDQETSLREDVGRWQAGFASAALLAGLPEDASADMAFAALDVWRTVPDLLAERENRQRRVRGMMRDMDLFEEKVRTLCDEVAPDLAALPADAAAGMLNDRAGEARTARNQQATLSAALERAELAARRHAEDAAIIERELIDLAQVVSKGTEDLPSVLEALHERGRIETSLRQCRTRFAEQADGASEDDIRGELSGFDRIAAGLEIERLESEDNRQVDRISALRTARSDNERRRREMETGIGAERAVFQKLAAETEAKELARRWVVLKLAAGLLSSSMETYREQQADPVMRRAGELFAGLTGGRFARLLQLYDERDDLQLAVERQGGEQVPLSGLSEGTGDQLYLALRLAFLEDYCRRNEPAPLVLDDIFQTFDDERTAAGLRTLAAAGSTHQTLLFTHQLSVVETAEKELGGKVDVVRL